MSARFRTLTALAALAAGGLLLAGCTAGPNPDDADAREAITASFEQTGWADDLTPEQLATDTSDALESARNWCELGYFERTGDPAWGHAILSAMNELCPGVELAP